MVRGLRRGGRRRFNPRLRAGGDLQTKNKHVAIALVSTHASAREATTRIRSGLPE